MPRDSDLRRGLRAGRNGGASGVSGLPRGADCTLATRVKSGSARGHGWRNLGVWRVQYGWICRSAAARAPLPCPTNDL